LRKFTVAHTVELLSLIEKYPDAFLEPTEAPLAQNSKTISQSKSSKNTELLGLISEFPSAFMEPEPPQTSSPSTSSSPVEPIQSESVEPLSAAIPAPPGYELAFHQTIQTYGWGTVNVHLRYDSERLTALWITVGKSGTEVQSFCEAIARLTNRLLDAGTPIPELVKELRGIRGGDSEGFGPHRFLGLVDLFGKVLQDAPTQMVTQPIQPDAALSAVAIAQSTVKTPEVIVEASPAETLPLANVTAENHQWVELSDSSAIASICPECGAELQQVNGCSGGACVVCGFSSCS
jgi:hypothetical protein